MLGRVLGRRTTGWGDYRDDGGLCISNGAATRRSRVVEAEGREKGEGRREKGEGRREKGEGRREITTPSAERTSFRRKNVILGYDIGKADGNNCFKRKRTTTKMKIVKIQKLP